MVKIRHDGTGKNKILISMFKLNLIIALRNLWKHKGYSLINIGGLAIGLASCLMLLLYVNYEWSYDKQFKNIDRIYGVCKNISADSLKITGTRGTFSNSLCCCFI